RSGRALAAQDPPLYERRVGSGQIKPRLRILRLTPGPGVAGRDGRRGDLVEGLVEPTTVRIEEDLPPHRDRRERSTGLRRRRRTGFGELRLDARELRLQ